MITTIIIAGIAFLFGVAVGVGIAMLEWER